MISFFFHFVCFFYVLVCVLRSLVGRVVPAKAEYASLRPKTAAERGQHQATDGRPKPATPPVECRSQCGTRKSSQDSGNGSNDVKKERKKQHPENRPAGRTATPTRTRFSFRRFLLMCVFFFSVETKTESRTTCLWSVCFPNVRLLSFRT